MCMYVFMYVCIHTHTHIYRSNITVFEVIKLAASLWKAIIQINVILSHYSIYVSDIDNSNIVKYYLNDKFMFSIWIYFKL